jgi:anaerobic magnesium-protoporphyrin IX monomethyl ester cyclase
MKNIVLYYPIIHGDSDSTPLYTGLPLSVLTIAAQFDSRKIDVRIVDGRVESNPEELLLDAVNDETVCLGVSSMTSYQIKAGILGARAVKNAYPSLPVVWGGWHPSLMPMQTIVSEFVDIIVVGQGEKAFLELVNCLMNGEDLSTVDNILFKTKENKVITTNCKPLKSLDSVKTFRDALKFIDVKKYFQKTWGNERLLGYEASRGCPYSCKFCSISSVYKHGWIPFPADSVVDDIEYLYKTYDIDAIHFFDNNFFVDPKRALDIGRKLKKRSSHIRWDGTAVVEQFVKFTPEYIKELKKTGFYKVIAGVESGDEDVLRLIHKQHTNRQVEEMVELCEKNGIQMSLSFMVGFPWNPEKDFEETISLIEKIKARSPSCEILLFIFSPYIGTPLYNIALEHGMIYPDNLEGWAEYTYDKSNTPWVNQKLTRKISRYISFFGTKDMSKELLSFLEAGKV